nr:hypothetical protein GCM10025730_04270 [Promicromonospora thailandica]
MAKYLLLKHYRRNSGPAWLPGTDVPMDRWTPEEITEHIDYMRRFAEKLTESGEFVGEERSRRRAPSSGTTARAAHRSPTAPSRRPRTSSRAG